MPRPANHHQLTISHADASPFAEEGLRSCFEYRQLGIDKATTGEFGAGEGVWRRERGLTP